MAVVRGFSEAPTSTVVHPTAVDCDWNLVAGPESYLQLSTYGSDHRQSKKKVSQTLQIDREVAVELMQIIKKVFPGLE